MKRLVLLTSLLCGTAAAQSAGNGFQSGAVQSGGFQDGGSQQGAWIWDRTRFVPAPNAEPGLPFRSETMTIHRDDRQRYAATLVRWMTDGSVWSLSEDIPEDGAFHAIGDPAAQQTLSITVLDDGARRVRSTWGADSWDDTCRLSEDRNTLTCEGVYSRNDGSKGAFVCVYDRDPHSIPIS